MGYDDLYRDYDARRERALAMGVSKRPVAEGDESIDVRDTGRSDQVFHAGREPRRVGGQFAPDRGSTLGRTGCAPFVGGERWALGTG